MVKVLFFFENAWAFGSIHNALAKELYSHGIHTDIIDWGNQYIVEEFDFLNSVYDYFVTIPSVAMHLYQYCGIPMEKIVAVGHGQVDILKALDEHGKDLFNQIKKYAVISNTLKKKSIEFGVERIPEVTKTAVHFDMFYSKPADSLKTIGYGGAKEAYDYYGNEIKRGYLVENVVNEIDKIDLKTTSKYNNYCMPGYYKTIDGLVVSSTQEAGCLPALEAAAAGRLVMGTPVGFLGEDGEKGAGILLPMEENNFKQKLKDTIEMYRDDSQLYKSKCEEIQTFAREHYDWRSVIYDWVQLFSDN